MVDAVSLTDRLNQQAQSKRTQLEQSLMQGNASPVQPVRNNENASLAGTNLLMQSMAAPDQRRAAAQQQGRLDEEQAYNRLTAQNAVDYQSGQDTLSNTLKRDKFKQTQAQDSITNDFNRQEQARLDRTAKSTNQVNEFKFANAVEQKKEGDLTKAAQEGGNTYLMRARKESEAAQKELMSAADKAGVAMLPSGEIDVAVPEKQLISALKEAGITDSKSKEAKVLEKTLSDQIYAEGDKLMQGAYADYQAKATSDKEFRDQAYSMVDGKYFKDADAEKFITQRKGYIKNRAALPELEQGKLDAKVQAHSQGAQLKIDTATKMLDLMVQQGDGLSAEIARMGSMTDNQLEDELKSTVINAGSSSGNEMSAANTEELLTEINNITVKGSDDEPRNLNAMEKIAFAKKAIIDGEILFWDADYNNIQDTADAIATKSSPYQYGTSKPKVEDKQTNLQALFEGMSSDITKYINNLDQTEALKKDILDAKGSIATFSTNAAAAANLAYSSETSNKRK